MTRMKLSAVFCLALGASPATGQETTDGGDAIAADLAAGMDPVEVHETELADLQRRLEVQGMRFMIASEIAKIAEEEAKTAVAQAEGAEQKRLKTVAEVSARQSTPGRISLITSRLTSKANPSEACDTKWFLAYRCNGLPECAVVVDAGACGGLSGGNQPMDMTVEYMCGRPDNPDYETRKGAFQFRGFGKDSQAYLTCY